MKSMASSATTLTQELESVYDSGGTVTKKDLLELETVEITKSTEIYWSPELQIELISPWSEEGAKTNYPIDTNRYFEEGCISAVKYIVIDEGVEYSVYCGTENASVLTVFRAENTATGEVFYDDSYFETVETTPILPETETE